MKGRSFFNKNVEDHETLRYELNRVPHKIHVMLPPNVPVIRDRGFEEVIQLK